MGIYSEYLDRQFNFQALSAERKKQLTRISKIRGGRDVLVFAANLNDTRGAPVSITYEDLLPIGDQLANLQGDALDLILETPGGSGEAAEDIVKLLRGKFRSLAVIVPGWAKSAGTIMVMAGDEILMEPASALGPIDAQIQWQGKVFSADALIEGFEKIKKEVEEAGSLNKAYIPVLQGISPGELQSAQNALKFARELVKDWLAKYKFQDWERHSSTGLPVTEEEKQARAEDVAKQLCDHRRWLTHGRSLKIEDLRRMGLRIVDYSQQADLADAVRRYHTLLQMTFASTTIYKVFETPSSQILRMAGVPFAPGPQQADAADVDLECPQCKKRVQIQANLGKKSPVKPGCISFPKDNKYRCACGFETDLTEIRRQIEAQSKKPVVT